MVSTLGPDLSRRRPRRPLAPLLADGYDLVLDFERSHGAWLHDSRSGREYLDFCMFFASNPIGYNHPKMKDPEFLAGPAPGGPAEAGALRLLQRRVRVRSSTSSARSRCPSTCATPSSSRAVRSASRTRSRPPSTGKCARTARRASPARRGSRSSTSARLSTAAPATRCRSPTPTRARPTSSRSFRGRGSRTLAALPRHARGRARDRRRRAAGARRRSSRPSRTTRTTSPRS